MNTYLRNVDRCLAESEGSPLIRLRAIVTLAICVFFFGVQAQGAAPTLIPFQGRLTDQVGRAYTDGQYTITFTLYSLAVGGDPLWTETHERVGVVNGMVNVFLGSIVSLEVVSFSETRHLGITIDADNNPNTPDPEMVPRQMIIPAFWARRADNASKLQGNDWSAILVGGSTNPTTGLINGAKIGNNTITQLQIADGQINARTLGNAQVTAAKLAPGAIGTTNLAEGAVTSPKIADGTILINDLATNLIKYLNPPGTIVAFGGNTIPDGWELCDGRVIQRAGKYADLFTAIGTAWGSESVNDFRLPDLRGYFLRGRADRQTSDPDRNTRTGRYTGGATGDNVGSYQADEFKSHTHSSYVYGGHQLKSGGSVIPNQSGQTGVAGTSSETRPKNAYVNYIIKY
ncbi:MAG: tail fiber protein [Verrucomicrobia bacterium]|nr:tail fiber protein [Verrucomicrobiota bacterium]